MRINKRSIVAVAIVILTVAGGRLSADPCGMVPPIYSTQEIPLARVGLQQTYVFYQDGVETFVIRPGFSGKVDEFGMLIPFPTPPAVRKVPDNIFGHLAAAVDPPEVVVDLRRQFFLRSRRGGLAVPKSAAAPRDDSLKFDTVKVIKQEAVGMYEVAVLAAGSAQALKRWMDDHGYKYPGGMDGACNDYVEAGWCFVAVKTKVGNKGAVDPRPGQKEVDPKLPTGAAFDGHVQGMGFRFKVDELVVPMRLSAFNAGELRNVVYLLTEGPRKIRAIPEEYIMRQIDGEQLYKNLTDPLPLRLIGGTEKDIPDYIRRGLPQQRDPVPKNGAARNLFASDLLSVKSGELSLPHEETEKELLRIGESLGLRGGDIDKANAQALAEQREKSTLAALADIKKMTLTVVDGDFPREVLRTQNLTFAEYEMPADRNKAAKYDAKLNGPAPKREGILKFGALAPADDQQQQVASAESAANPLPRGAWLAPLLIGFVGLVLAGFLRRRPRRATVVAILFLAAAAGVGLTASAAEEKAPQPTIRQLLSQLSKSETAADAVDAIVARGAEAKPLLLGEAIEGNDLPRRGWSIVALSRIGGDDVERTLKRVYNDDEQPSLVRNWAAAAHVAMLDSADDLLANANLVTQFPALGRPLGMRLIEQMNAGGEATSPAGLLGVTLKVPQLQSALAPAILSLGSGKLTDVLTTAADQNIRRQAAAYLGTLAQQGDETVAKQVVAVYKIDPDAADVPWKGGPLFVPGIDWQQADARALARNLIAWHLWCDRKGKTAEQNQIHNNLRSIALAAAAGYQTPGFRSVDTPAWLATWGKALGRAEVEQMLKDQGVEDVEKYASVLAKL